mmetsp:Transcript_16434/g.34882  ORF Transcript_16434/g.34882 Transcript_16434/m.34882 type:complete len:225 (-) Transcript_16434:417-1091(-)
MGTVAEAKAGGFMLMWVRLTRIAAATAQVMSAASSKNVESMNEPCDLSRSPPTGANGKRGEGDESGEGGSEGVGADELAGCAGGAGGGLSRLNSGSRGSGKGCGHVGGGSIGSDGDGDDGGGEGVGGTAGGVGGEGGRIGISSSNKSRTLHRSDVFTRQRRGRSVDRCRLQLLDSFKHLLQQQLQHWPPGDQPGEDLEANMTERFERPSKQPQLVAGHHKHASI